MRKSSPAGETRVACPAYAVCAEWGTARSTCRYERRSLPPVGLSTYQPEQEWCPSGIATLILQLRALTDRGASGRIPEANQRGEGDPDAG